MLVSLLVLLTLGIVGRCQEIEEDGGHDLMDQSICYEKVQADVIFLLDISTSIGRVLWHKEAKFAAGVVEGFIVGSDDVLFGALIFNRSPTKIFDLNSDRSISETLLAISYPNIRGTKTHLGLSKIRNENLFSTEAGGRPDARDFVVVVTDGLSNNPSETKKEAQLLKDSGVTVIAVGVGAANTKELAALASGPEYIFTAKSFSQLDSVKINLVLLICNADIPPTIITMPTQTPTITATTPTTTTTTPTTTTTTPTTTTNTPTTTTTTPTTTTTTPTTTTTTTTPTTTTSTTTTTTTSTTTKPTTTTTTTLGPPPTVVPCHDETRADIILLIDASRSIGSKNWVRQVKFAAELVQAFTIGPEDVLFGCLIFNSVPTKLFDLKTYTNQTAIAATLLGTPYPDNSGTYTHLGLSEIRNNHLFNTTAGGRDDAKDLLIVMTDGLSYDSYKTKRESQRLRDLGVTIMTLGIGLENTEELAAMASGPEYVFNVGNYSMLDYVKSGLVKKACHSAVIAS